MTARGVFVGFLAVAVLMPALSGCKDGAGRNEQPDATETKEMLAKAKAELARAKGELAELKDELKAVSESRDELDMQVAQLVEQRDKAVTAAQSAQSLAVKLTARSSDQTQGVAALGLRQRSLGESIQ